MPGERRSSLVDPNAEEEEKLPTYGKKKVGSLWDQTMQTFGFGGASSEPASDFGDPGVDPYFQGVDRARDSAVEKARRIAAEVRSGIKSVEEAGDKGRGLMRRQAAQGLSAGIGATAGRAAGAGKIGALQQGALDQGARQAEFEVGQAARLAAARQKAAEADLGADVFAKEAEDDFTTQEDKMGRRFVEVVSPYKDQGLGGWRGNDEVGAANALEKDLLPTIKNSVLRARLIDQIARIRSGEMKF
jgi:hypothetical protein